MTVMLLIHLKLSREKVKELGQEYTPRQYAIQVIVFAVGAAVVTYLYFYNIIVSIIYAIAAGSCYSLFDLFKV